MSARMIQPLIAALVLLAPGLAAAEDDADLVRRGRTVIAANCATCHAIGRTGNSAHREAPPFRTLSRRYPIESLSEALAEG